MIRVFSFLQRNPDSGILYFRYIIPERYRQTIGKKEIKRSLRTTDRRVAIPLASKYHAQIQEKLFESESEMKKRRSGIPSDAMGKITVAELQTCIAKA